MTLLFIHGFATGPAVWKEQIKEFSRDHEIITDAEGMRERKKNEVLVVGWSMGGWKAIELFQEHPSKVRGLVLVSAFAKYLKSDDYPAGTSPALLRKLERNIKADFKEGLRYFYGLVFRGNKWHSLIEELPVPEKEDVDRWFDRLRTEDKRAILPQIKVPVLLIHGEQDEIALPGAAQFLHEKIAGSELHIFPGVGHAPMVEAPELFNIHLRRFIEKYAG